MFSLVFYPLHLFLGFLILWYPFVYRAHRGRSTYWSRTILSIIATIFGFTYCLLGIKLFAVSMMFPGIIYLLPEILQVAVYPVLPSILVFFLFMAASSYAPFPLTGIIEFFGLVFAAVVQIIFAYFLMVLMYAFVIWGKNRFFSRHTEARAEIHHSVSTVKS